MHSIEVDFEVWKALTARRQAETHSYNDVIRQLLELPATSSKGDAPVKDAKSGGGRFLGGRWLPDGTTLRAKYKGQQHQAEIRDGQLVDAAGKTFSSASAAAKAITSTSVNGLTFWSVKRPSDTNWLSLLFIEKTK